MPGRRPLSVGILLNSYLVDLWAYSALDKAIRNGSIRISALILRNAPEPPKRSRFRRLFSPRALFWFLYRAADRLLTRVRLRGRIRAHQLRDIRDLAPEAEVIEVIPKATGWSDYILPDDSERIKALDLDILFRRGFRILRGDILSECSRYGVWSYHHGDNRVNRGAPPGFWEFLEGWDCAGAILQILTEDLDGGTVLAKTTCRTRNARTWGELRNQLYWKASEMLPRCLRVVAEHGVEGLNRLSAEHAHPFCVYDGRLYRPPNARSSLRGLFKLAGSVLSWVANKARCGLMQAAGRRPVPGWAILYRRGETSGPSIELNMRKFTRIISPRGRFWADPFLAERCAKRVMFFEDYYYDQDKAVIAAAELSEDGLAGPPVTVLEEPFHLSYPHLFEYQDELYMIPECRESGQIRLYKCTTFPHRWELERVVRDNVSAVDTTVFEHEGRWWMFSSIRSHTGSEDSAELHLFCSASPLGDWTPHAMNPVSMNVRRARPAGNVFRLNGKLYRPGQIGISEGWGIALCEITSLSPEVYEEKVVEVIEPRWARDVIGVHTLNIYPDCILADVRLRP